MNILWIDDVRKVPEKYENDEVTIATNYYDAINFIDVGWTFPWDIVDFDHDIGTEGSGYDIAKYIVESELKIGGFRIHSQNPVGVSNIRQLLTHYGYKEV